MRINPFQLALLVMRSGQVLSVPGPIPQGDAGLYLLARSLCEQLERTNPGIAQAAGFDYPLQVIEQLPSKLPRVPLAKDKSKEVNLWPLK
jgi:hypothetical protein